jgi:hypothetical protein
LDYELVLTLTVLLVLLNLFQVVQTLYIIPEAQQDYDTAMLIQ